ncbi:MAG TPA: alpha/beta hydrolase [Syntrophorhabdaceae bacterium]|nr:alpha/beta hydrolase [Syntrophorhabdaceae bacterium]
MTKRSLSFAGIFIIYILFVFMSAASGASIEPALPAGAVSSPAISQSVRAGDISMGYTVIGEGYPLVLITGYSATMDMWDPLLIKNLSSHYKVILFDNRGMGRTSASARPFSVELFVEDTVGLMDALKIKKAHILGWSMGTFIAMELALKHPDRVDKLVLYAGACGWKGGDVIKASPDVIGDLTDLSGTGEERSKRLVNILFPKKWLQDHPGFLDGLPRPQTPPSMDSIRRQDQAMGTWPGVCDRLAGISQPALFITGTEDVVIPPANSLLMASRIPSSWLIRLPGGHSNMYQYPATFARCILDFLGAEKE